MCVVRVTTILASLCYCTSTVAVYCHGTHKATKIQTSPQSLRMQIIDLHGIMIISTCFEQRRPLKPCKCKLFHARQSFMAAQYTNDAEGFCSVFLSTPFIQVVWTTAIGICIVQVVLRQGVYGTWSRICSCAWSVDRRSALGTSQSPALISEHSGIRCS